MVPPRHGFNQSVLWFPQGTNSNGERLVTKPGQGVIVPANWDGEFLVPQGVLKIWIIYQE